MNEQYRLLNVGEQTQVGDEYYDYGEWHRASDCVYTLGAKHAPHRRPIAPPEWIPIKDRAPEFPCVLGGYTDGGQWTTCTCLHGPPGRSWTHSCPIPPPPAPAQSEDD